MKKKGHPVGRIIQTGATALGSLFGGPAGAVVGGAAGKMMNHILGIGSYQSSLKRNDLFDPRMGVVAVNSSAADGSIVISRREFLQNVSGSVNFSASQYALNPGLISSFPYLSSIASQFEFYEFEGLVFYFRSTSATAVSSTNTALGTVIMAAEYNVNSAAFTSKQQAETTRYVVSGKPSEDLIFPVECDPRELNRINYLIRTGALSGTAMISDYDLANVFFMTEGMQAANTIGELWVSYKVRLRNPIIRTVSTSLINRAVVVGVAGGTGSFLGTTASITSYGTVFVTSGSDSQITFSRPGTYLAFSTVNAGTGTVTAASLGTTCTVSLGGSVSTQNSSRISAGTDWGGSNKMICHDLLLTVTTAGAVFTFKGTNDAISAWGSTVVDIIMLT